MPARQHKLLVTGADGFVGKWLLAELYRDDTEVHGLVNRSDGTPIDVRDAEAVSRLVQELAPTAIIHLAAVSTSGHAQQDPALAWQVNVMGTLNLAHACRQHSPGARFIYVSSSEAYGAAFREAGPLTEDAALEPLTTYGATKAAAEVLVQQMARAGLDAMIFRPFNHTGPDQTDHFVAPSFARQIALIERGTLAPVLHVGSLHVRRDFLDVRDVVRAYANASRRTDKLASGEIFNLATGRPIAIQEIVDTLMQLSKRPVEVVQDPSLARPNEISVASGSPVKAEALLAWKPTRVLRDTLEELLNAWRHKFAQE